jgi:hypothetical protein
MVSRTARKVDVKPKPKPTAFIIDIESPIDEGEEDGVLNAIEQDLIDQIVYEDEMRFRTISGIISLFVALFGVFLILIGKAERGLETEDGKILWVDIMGYSFQLPLFIWCIFICCPTSSERGQRRVIKNKHNKRLVEYSKEEVENIVDSVAIKKQELEKDRKRNEENVIAQAAKDESKRKEENKAKAQRQKIRDQKETKWHEEDKMRKQKAYQKSTAVHKNIMKR